jgi:Uncharacterized protein conserved in bacteria
VAVLSPTDCQREIETLHDLFVRWYRGEAERDEFERLERALADSFEMVSPDGRVSDRETVLDGIRTAYDTRTGFDIEIRNVELVARVDEHALVRYEEWQYSPAGTAGDNRESSSAGTAGDNRESSPTETVGENRESSPTETVGENRESSPAETVGENRESSPAATAGETQDPSPVEERDGTGRLSTVLLAPVGDEATTRGETDPAIRPVARWQYLQETWLDGPDR